MKEGKRGKPAHSICHVVQFQILVNFENCFKDWVAYLSIWFKYWLIYYGAVGALVSSILMGHETDLLV